MKYAWSIALAALVAASAFGATAPPSAGVWNIATTGKAASSGDLAFRVTATDGSDPVEITVPVIAGAGEEAMARTIRRALSAQLPRDRYNVELGEGGNVLVSDPRGRPNFTLELLDSDIDNVRVAVQSVTPSAAPTVPPQSTPAVPPPVSNPAQPVPGNAAPPASTAPPAIITPSQGAANQPIPVPDPVRAPAPSAGAPSPSPAAPPPASVPAPAPSVPPANAPPVPDNAAPPGTTPPPAAPPMSPPPNSTGGAGASATAPPASSPPPR
jgi:hypothetical protein